MNDVETLLGEEAVDPGYQKSDRAKQDAPAQSGESPPHKEGETLPVPVRSSERRAEAFLTEWLRRLVRS